MAETIQSELLNAEDLQRRLHAIEGEHPKMRRDIRKMISYVLREARKSLRNIAHAKLDNDPHKSYMAVRNMVYKRIFGGNVSILSKRRANNKMYVGGNHSRPRGDKTKQIDEYWGDDRGFILRFLNVGTKVRTATTMNAEDIRRTERPKSKRTYKGGIGNRGKIVGAEWFGTSAKSEMDRAAAELSALVARAIYEVWGESAVYADII